MACILTLPPYQRRGYGKLLIEFSEYVCCGQGAVHPSSVPHRQMCQATVILNRGCAARSLGEPAINNSGTLPEFSPFRLTALLIWGRFSAPQFAPWPGF